MKYPHILLLIAIICILLSCKQQPKTQNIPPDITLLDTLSYSENTEDTEPEPEIERPALKHYFKNNLLLGAFFADSTAFRATKNGYNSQYFDIDPQQITPSDQTYEEWDTFLSFGRIDIWDFFDDTGHIVPGWELINYHKVISPLQITNFVTDLSELPSNKIKYITSTCLIFMPYTSKNPQKPTSLEIVMESVDDDLPIRDTYFTTPEPDEYQKWQAFTAQTYAEKGISSIYLTDDEQYLSFNLSDGYKVIIDITTDQNGLPYTALLYRSGHIPILFHLKPTEEDEEIIQRYIGE